MKAEISGNVVEVRRKSDRVMTIVLTLGREVIRINESNELSKERGQPK